MEYYSVKKLAKLAGVSVRTLHLYDHMGLLTPSVRTEARYRLYGEKDLLRLQQILFYRELDLPLKEIGDILDDPAFDLAQALESHKMALRAKHQRISTLIETIDKTLDHLKNKTMLDVEELYDGLSSEKMTAYREEAMQRWGKERVQQGEDILRKLSKSQLDVMKKELEIVMKQLSAAMGKDPLGREVQTLVAVHYKLMLQFTGRTPEQGTKEFYIYLSEMYIQDERYTTVNGVTDPAFTQFMQQAMKHYAEVNLP